MLYRKIPKTGDEISSLGFGVMRLPLKLGRIDEKRAVRQVHQCIAGGVNYFDTAMSYHMGASEPFLGRALSGGHRQKVKIATKLTPHYIKTHQDMDSVLTSQLRTLQTDHIDYYLLHSLDRRFWNFLLKLDVLKFLDRAKKEGRIVYAGFSFHGDKDVFPEIVDAYDWEFCQIQYNILDENNQAGTEGLEYAGEKRLGVIVMEPLRGGTLATRIPPAVASVWKQAPVSRTPVEWMLRWIWNHPQVTCVLSGMNREEHIEENIRIAGEALPDSLTKEELQLIERARDAYLGTSKVDCNGCRYCMPCPSGVDIPACFEYYNNYHLFGRKFIDKMVYRVRLDGMTGEPSFPSRCIECGECLEKCPQQIEIPERLKEVTRDFEGRAARSLHWLAKKLVGWRINRILERARRAE